MMGSGKEEIVQADSTCWMFETVAVQGSRRTDLTRRPRQRMARDLAGTSYACWAPAGAAPNSNSVPSTHMRCMMTASLRATATQAFFMPTF